MKRSAKRRALVSFCVFAVASSLSAGPGQTSGSGAPVAGNGTAVQTAPPALTLTSVVPYAVPQHPPGLTLPQIVPWFDTFSWQSFIALNWPAALNPDGTAKRGVPDTGKSIGDTGPRVWESWKADYELFQGDGSAPSAWSSYDVADPPCIVPTAGHTAALRLKVVPLIAKGGSVLPHSVNQAIAGPVIDQNSNYLRYEIRLNQPYYDFVSTNKYYLQSNLPKYPAPKIKMPSTVQGTYGVMEVKASWREMTVQEMNDPTITGRYYIVQAIIATPGAPPTNPCRMANLGLIGLHIAHKVSPFTGWVWSTFEQEDNVPDGGPPPPGGKYSLNSGTQIPGDSTSKTLGYYPANSWQAVDPSKPLPPASPTQVARINPIPASTLALNQSAKNLLTGTVWEHYKLIATQWPTVVNFDNVVDNPQSSTTAYPTGAGTPFPNDGVANVAAETYYQTKQAYLPDALPLFGTSCMQCHYLAVQYDFSWVLPQEAYPANPAAAGSRSRRPLPAPR